MKKQSKVIFTIKIGAATLIGAVAGIVLTLILGKNKQIKLQAERMADSITNTVRNKTDDMQDTLVKAAEGADDAAKTVRRKVEDVAEDINQNYQKVKKDFGRKVEDALDEVDKHVTEK